MKLTQKTLIIIAAIILLAIVAVGFAIYANFQKQESQKQGSDNSIITGDKTADQTGDGAQDNTKTENDGGLFICADKCGDGNCDNYDNYHCKDNNPNCACKETEQDCPIDCSE